MKIEAYVGFNGDCEQAMEFYRSVFGGELNIMRWAEAPADMSCPEQDPAWGQKVLHSILKLPEAAIMASDVPPAMGYVAPNSAISLAVSLPSTEEGRRVFTALSAGGEVGMPMTKTFWAEAFGMVKDRFGVSWMVSAGVAECD
ncbi:VOC family protein [Verticiella sediminum]|uniref:VOC family protein n=1 Tax=Verticiella sediminum TaxID=1247510 RepID=A0A556AYK5_9BURK|nr:VOC family protein [Verticiella sediminum]TSH98017.1 VOC family protein [Verticiella sediminum]